MFKFLLFFLLASLSFSDAQKDTKTILIFGDSITAGYGLDPEQAFPAFIQQKIDDQNLPWEVVNAGLSGETSAGGLRRVDWILQRHIDVFVLELGGNDGLRGLNPELTKQNLAGIMDKVRTKYPKATIILTGMEAPPNLGDTYTNRFRAIYKELSQEYDVIFMPFILEDVGGIPELNLPDGIHPTEDGHRIIAKNLWEYLEPVLEKW